MDCLVTSQRLRDLYLVACKMVDVGARAGFVLTAIYGLAIADAGRFGIIATLVGLFAFAFNFERQIDIQRRSAGEPHGVFDRHVTQALKFFAFNWALMVPVFILTVALWTGISWPLVLLATVVVVAEHLSNQVYQYALINPRYYTMLLVVTAKNSAMALILLYQTLLVSGGASLGFVLELWAAGAVLSTAALAVMFLRIRDAAPKPDPFSFRTDILGQHRASMTHFAIGLIAILILQFDRLAVGALMSFEQTGVYFRHTLLVAFAYQAFNIASYNRITPTIFAAAKVEGVATLVRLVLLEYRKTLIGVPLLIAAAWAADAVTGGVWSDRFQLELGLMALLLLGFTLRAAADFPALIMNARHEERFVLRSQLAAFIVGGCALVGLTLVWGVWGTAVAAVLTSGLYAALNWQILSRLPPEPYLARPGGEGTTSVEPGVPL